MRVYARIVDGVVVELIKTELNVDEMFHPDFIAMLIEVTDIGERPEEGWSAEFVNNSWVFKPYSVPQPSGDELRTKAIAKRDFLLRAADEATAGMSDAYVAGLLDENDTTLFKAYAAYKLSLNKVDKQSGFPKTIEWPSSPY